MVLHNRAPTKLSVSFIVVAYNNTKDELASLFESLQDGASRAAVSSTCVLVSNDNKYTDRDFPDAIVRTGHGNVGFAKGVRLGLMSSSSDYVIVANPDLSISAQDACRFVGRLTRGHEVLVPVIHDAFGNVAFTSYEDWVFSIGRKFSERICREFLIRDDRELLPRWVRICGAFVGMPRQLAEQFGPFDEDFFMYGEDRDLSRRLRRAQIPVSLTRDVVVTHIGGKSGVGMNRVLAIVRADSAMRVAYRKYGSLGVWLKRYDLLLEAMRKRGEVRTHALAARRFAVDRWGLGLAEAPRVEISSLALIG